MLQNKNKIYLRDEKIEVGQGEMIIGSGGGVGPEHPRCASVDGRTDVHLRAHPAPARPKPSCGARSTTQRRGNPPQKSKLPSPHCSTARAQAKEPHCQRSPAHPPTHRITSIRYEVAPKTTADCSTARRLVIDGCKCNVPAAALAGEPEPEPASTGRRRRRAGAGVGAAAVGGRAAELRGEAAVLVRRRRPRAEAGVGGALRKRRHGGGKEGRQRQEERHGGRRGRSRSRSRGGGVRLRQLRAQLR
jgi:hypothetical protein